MVKNYFLACEVGLRRLFLVKNSFLACEVGLRQLFLVKKRFFACENGLRRLFLVKNSIFTCESGLRRLFSMKTYVLACENGFLWHIQAPGKRHPTPFVQTRQTIAIPARIPLGRTKKCSDKPHLFTNARQAPDTRHPVSSHLVEQKNVRTSAILSNPIARTSATPSRQAPSSCSDKRQQI